MKLVCLFGALGVLVCASIAKGQALPAASREPIEVGAAFSFGSPDYNATTTYVEGVTGFATLGITRRFAAELAAHIDSLITPIDVGEDTYLIGPRFYVAREDRANLYVKVLGGLGRFEYQKGYFARASAQTYGVVAFGAGVEFRASRRFNIRAIDLEYQTWPGFSSAGALHPVVASTGIAYAF